MIKLDYKILSKAKNGNIEPIIDLYLNNIMDSKKKRIFKDREKNFTKLKTDQNTVCSYEVSVNKKKETKNFEIDLRTLFKDKTFIEIIRIDSSGLFNFIEAIEARINEQVENFDTPKYDNLTIEKVKQSVRNYLLGKIFDYESLHDDRIAPFFKETFDFVSCYYCNRNFINNFEKENLDSTEVKSTFQLDHFYEKSRYPYLAISFYNLIPCCSSCNTTVKNSEVKKDMDFYTLNCKPPNHKDFNFAREVKFKTFLGEKNKNLSFDNINSIDLKLTDSYNVSYKNYINIFRLNERYKDHRNLVIEMIKKRRRYPDSRIQELAKQTNQTFAQVKKDLFGDYWIKEEDFHKRPLSKLTRDIAEELGLI